MAETTRTTYEEIVRLADQLTRTERDRLIAHLQKKRVDPNDLSSEEWETLFDSLAVNVPVLNEPSDRREDWYGDDGR